MTTTTTTTTTTPPPPPTDRPTPSQVRGAERLAPAAREAAEAFVASLRDARAASFRDSERGASLNRLLKVCA